MGPLSWCSRRWHGGAQAYASASDGRPGSAAWPVPEWFVQRGGHPGVALCRPATFSWGSSWTSPHPSVAALQPLGPRRRQLTGHLFEVRKQPPSGHQHGAHFSHAVLLGVHIGWMEGDCLLARIVVLCSLGFALHLGLLEHIIITPVEDLLSKSEAARVTDQLAEGDLRWWRRRSRRALA